ncbi:MAG TPA: cold shock domain protein CspD [Acidimicrobiia bacterium]
MQDTYFGRVVAFDDRRGRGEVETATLRYPFHCTAIADGSRTVPEGAEVQFELVIGPLGQLEAAAIRPPA